MRYRNTQTGAVIETDCVCRGGDWETVSPSQAKKRDAPEGRKRTVKKDGKLCDD